MSENITFDTLHLSDNLIEVQEVSAGFDKGVQAAIGYVGKFAYIPIIALVLYTIIRRIPKKYDIQLIRPGRTRFGKLVYKYVAPMTLLELLESTTLALSIAAAGAMALMFYTGGSVVSLKPI